MTMVTSTHFFPLRSVDLMSLIRSEYREMPGLTVTLAQAARLWNVDRRQCFDALEALADEGFLRRSRGMYVFGDRSSTRLVSRPS